MGETVDALLLSEPESTCSPNGTWSADPLPAIAEEPDALASPEQSEAQFIARLQARDEAAFNELVLAYERRVFALVFRMLGRRDEAEDLSQEVFVQVFKAIDQFRHE